MRWIFAKTTYATVLCGFTINIVAITRLFLNNVQSVSGAYILPLSAANTLWLAWRLQETINWEIRWQAAVPYICHVMIAIRYFAESLSIAIFCIISFDRFMAILFPIIWHTSSAKYRMVKWVAIQTALCSILASVLTICVHFSYNQTEVSQTCVVPTTHKGPLTFLIAVTIIIVVLLYTIPAVVIITFNIAVTVRIINRQNARNLSVNATAKTQTKTKMVMMSLLISSLFLFVCLLKPIYDLILAIVIKLHSFDSSDTPLTMYARMIYFESVSWILTTVGFTLNVLGVYHLVLAGRMHSSQRKPSQ